MIALIHPHTVGNVIHYGANGEVEQQIAALTFTIHNQFIPLRFHMPAIPDMPQLRYTDRIEVYRGITQGTNLVDYLFTSALDTFKDMHIGNDFHPNSAFITPGRFLILPVYHGYTMSHFVNRLEQIRLVVWINETEKQNFNG